LRISGNGGSRHNRGLRMEPTSVEQASGRTAAISLPVVVKFEIT
jgi:hypothetical protein